MLTKDNNGTLIKDFPANIWTQIAPAAHTEDWGVALPPKMISGGVQDRMGRGELPAWGGRGREREREKGGGGERERGRVLGSGRTACVEREG